MSDLRGIDLNLLIVLDAVLAERNLTRAGDAIGLTQPAVSSAMAKLRRMLDDPLLVRSGRTSELTPRAQMLQPVVTEAVRAVERTLLMRPSFDASTSERTFRIVASDYALSIMTRPLLALLEERAPGVTVEFVPLNALDPVDLLRDDIAIVSTERGIAGRRRSLFSDTFACIVRRDHPHLVDGELPISSLSTLPYVRVTFNDEVLVYVDHTLAESGIRPRVARSVAGFLPVPFTVAGSDMYGFVPSRLADLYGAELDLVVARVQLHLPVLVEAAYWHPSRGDDPAVQWLLDVLLDVAELVEFDGD